MFQRQSSNLTGTKQFSSNQFYLRYVVTAAMHHISISRHLNAVRRCVLQESSDNLFQARITIIGKIPTYQSAANNLASFLRNKTREIILKDLEIWEI